MKFWNKAGCEHILSGEKFSFKLEVKYYVTCLYMRDALAPTLDTCDMTGEGHRCLKSYNIAFKNIGLRANSFLEGS